MRRIWQLKSISRELYLQFLIEKPFVIYFSTKMIDDIHRSLNLSPYVELKQIHSKAIWKVDSPLPPEELSGDGLMTSKPGLYLVVKVADCYPLFIVDPLNIACGVFHVGWRGLKEGIVEEAVLKFKEYFHSQPENLIAVFGPGIRAEYYEVGEEFRSYFPGNIIEKDSRFYLDIFQVAVSKLRRQGVKEIYGPPADTYSNPDLFHSKRRDVELKGLNRAIIGIEKDLSLETLIEDSPYNI
uniref:Purine nucleoside phosphorylase n=1 Tax=candidate division WOR-3 bacterium TaxID=2052148 RepID=A0A7V3ZZU8_UNCW3